jgi:hypothetical protein
MLVSASGSAQDRPAAPPSEPDAGILVQGRSAGQRHEQVKALTPADYGVQVGRWNQQICFHVEGLQPAYAQLVQNQFEAEAKHLKVLFSHSSGCSPNVVVAVADNADQLAQRIGKEARWLMADPTYGNPSKERADALMKPQPVRWFVANRKVKGFIPGASRIVLPSREETDYAYILVDSNKLGNITWRQLGDYIAFDVLAGPKPGAEFPTNSILSIFSERDAGRQGPLALTVQDAQFLDALYASDPDLPAEQQRRDIERLMKAYRPQDTP